MDYDGAIFNSMVGIPITEGVESFEKASIHLLKEASGLGDLVATQKCMMSQKEYLSKTLISLFHKVFKFKAYPLRKMTKYSQFLRVWELQL